MLFRSKREDLGSFYEMADVFAFPSLGDTQALVINEAAWAATPVVMVDRRISQIVEDGASGLFAAATAEDFGDKISFLLEQPRQAVAMGEAARSRAKELTAGRQAAKLARLYEETVSRRAARPLPLSALRAPSHEPDDTRATV